MIQARRATSVGAAVLLAGGAVVVTQQWTNSQVAQATAVVAGRSTSVPAGPRVLVAGQPLPAGTILKAEHLQWRAWPAESAGADYLTSASTSLSAVVGSVVRSDLGRGEPLTDARVVKPGDRSFLAAVLRPGYRAITLNVSASTGVAGFVFPGDHVDLILTRSPQPGAARYAETRTVLTDVRVVGVDQKAANAKQEVVVPQTATLEVSPAQAELIAAASELGKLSLTLRSLAEGQAPPAAPAPPAALRPPPRPQPRAVAAAPSLTVEVVRGGQLTPQGGAR